MLFLLVCGREDICGGSILVPRLKLLLQYCLLHYSCETTITLDVWVIRCDVIRRIVTSSAAGTQGHQQYCTHTHTRNTRHVQCVSFKSLLCLCYNILIIWCNYSCVCVWKYHRIRGSRKT